MRRRLHLCAALCGLVVFAACGGAGAGESPERVEVVGHFQGRVENGVVVRLEMLARPADAESQRVQALEVLPEDRDGRRGLASVPDVVELTTQGRADLPPDGYPVPQDVVDGCGPGLPAFELFAGVRNFHDRPLTAVHIIIDRFADTTVDNSLCNSDAVPQNLSLDGQPLPTALGLLRYGFLDADSNGPEALPPGGIIPLPRGTDGTARAVRWRFRQGGTFNFFGRVVGRVCDTDCRPGLVGTRFPDTNGTVLAVAEDAGIVHLGGAFTRVGPRTGAAALMPRSPDLPGVAFPFTPAIEGGVVDSIVDDAAGGYYVGGTFSIAGGVAQPRLVHVQSTGAIDPAFAPPTSLTATGTISALAFDAGAGRLWVGRDVSPHLAILDAANGVPVVTPPALNGAVLDLLVEGPSVFVAGAFEDFGGSASHDKLVRFNRSTGLFDPAFVATGLSTGVASRVTTIASNGSTVWAGGTFLTPRARAAAWPINGGTALPWNPNVSTGEVVVLRQRDGLVYLGGTFSKVRNANKDRLAAVADSGASPAVSPWNPAPDGTIVSSLAFDGAHLFVGGDFTQIGGVERRGVAAMSAAPLTTVRAFDPSPALPFVGVAAETRAIAFSGQTLLVGGTFTFAGGATRQRLASVDLASGALLAPDAGIADGDVRSVALRNGRLYLGGTFTAIGNQPRSRLAAVDVVTHALVAGFSPDVNDDIDTVATSAGHVYFGGDFDRIGRVQRGRLARVDFNGVLDGWNDPTNGTGFMPARVRTIAVLSGGDVLAGGDFASIGDNAEFPSVPARRLARLDATTGALLVDFNADQAVYSIAVSADERTAWAGGAFNAVSGLPRNRVVALDLHRNVVDVGFEPGGFNGLVHDVAVVGPTVIVVGEFGTPASRYAGIDGITGLLQPGAPLRDATGALRVVLGVGDVVVAGGALGAGTIVSTPDAIDGAIRRSNLIVVQAP